MKSLAQMKIFPVGIEGYKKINYIGSGSYSDIWKVEKDGEYYAMKVVKIRDINPITLKHLKTELTILRVTDHPCIIKLVEAIETENQLILILELCSEDFKNRIFDEKRKFRNELTETDILVYFRQIVIGIQYLHQNHIIHRDIKYENILICDDLIKISDFGLSVITPENEYVSYMVGSPYYMAPEMIKEELYSYGVDVWSLGVLFYSMLHKGKMPFDIDREEVKQYMLQHIEKNEAMRKSLFRSILNEEPEIDSKITKSTRDLLTKVLEKNPNERISVDQILSHPALNIGNIYYVEITEGGETKDIDDGYIFYTDNKPSKVEEYISFNVIGEKLEKGTLLYGAYIDYYAAYPKIVPFRLEEKARENVEEAKIDTEVEKAFVVLIKIA